MIRIRFRHIYGGCALLLLLIIALIKTLNALSSVEFSVILRGDLSRIMHPRLDGAQNLCFVLARMVRIFRRVASS